MGVREVVEKKKGMSTCADCGKTVDEGMTECPECGSTSIKKSIIIIRKETVDVDDEIVDEDDDEEDDDEDDEEDEDEGEEDDAEEEKEVLNDPPVVLAVDDKKIAGVEALNLSTALAEGVVKILSGDISKASSAYEDVMTDFNTVMDTAFEQWVAGNTVSKAGDLTAQTTLIKNRITTIMKDEGAVMSDTRPTAPAAVDDVEVPPVVQTYIDALEAYADSLEEDESGEDDTVGKSGVSEEEDIFKGLTPKAADIVRKAAETNERAEVQKFVDVAKGFTHIPGDKDELAKSLRLASDASEDVYKNLIETLTAANENLVQSDVFKSYGRPGSGKGEISKRTTEAAELVSKGLFATIEQAEVSMMNGGDYKATTEAN